MEQLVAGAATVRGAMGRGSTGGGNGLPLQKPQSAAEAFELTSWVGADGIRVLQIDSSPEIDEDEEGPRFRLYLNDALIHGPERQFGANDSDEQPQGEKALFLPDVPAGAGGAPNLADTLAALQGDGLVIQLCESCGYIEGEEAQASLCRRCGRAWAPVAVRVKQA
jgi:hypothetical protein